MQQLSYSNRSTILEIVERLKTAAQLPDDELRRPVSTFLHTDYAHAGFEHTLTTDSIAVSHHSRVSRMSEVEDTAHRKSVSSYQSKAQSRSRGLSRQSSRA